MIGGKWVLEHHVRSAHTRCESTFPWFCRELDAGVRVSRQEVSVLLPLDAVVAESVGPEEKTTRPR